MRALVFILTIITIGLVFGFAFANADYAALHGIFVK